MRFAHLADVHIGAWRDARLKELPMRAFEQTVSAIIERACDFALLCGDFYNTAVPPLDLVKRSVTQLQRLKEAGIPVYVVAGSHDYSASGKTMLDVLEEAGLLVTVMKGDVVKGKITLRFTIDPKTKVKLTGILGRAGSLDKHYYEDLDRDRLERELGAKIFLFHASIAELKPKGLGEMEAQPASMLPRGFEYYAGGHVHIRGDTSLPGYKNIVYPGPLFPANFAELEELGHGSFCIVDDWHVERVAVVLQERLVITIDADKKSAASVNQELEKLAAEDVADKIVLLRVEGELSEGRVTDVHLTETARALEERGAIVLRNTMQLSSKEFAHYAVAHGSAADVEERVIREHAGQTPGLDAETEITLVKELLATLGADTAEGEKKYEHDERAVRAARNRLENSS